MTRRLLLFCPDYKPAHGGIAELSYRLADELSKPGADVTVLAQPADAGAFDADQRFRTVRNIFPIRLDAVGRLRNAAEAVGYRRRLGRLADSLEIDYCLSTQSPHPLWSWALLALGRPVGVVLHGDEVVRHPTSRRIKKYNLRRLMAAATDVFCNSRFTADAAGRIFGPNLPTTVIGCGVAPDDLPAAVDRSTAREELKIQARTVLLTVGRLVERKGIDTMIQAMPRVLARYPDALYVVAGEGADRARLERLAGQVGCAAHVRLDGAIDRRRLAHYYGAADVFVMASREIPGQSVEGFGIVYLEAAWYGLAAVAGRSGGAPDAVIDGQTGLLVEGSSEDQLAEAVLQLLADPGRRQALGQAGRRRVLEEMTWTRVAERVRQRIEATLGPPRPAADS